MKMSAAVEAATRNVQFRCFAKLTRSLTLTLTLHDSDRHIGIGLDHGHSHAQAC